jgi:glycerol-3-phosphate dehydrogenase
LLPGLAIESSDILSTWAGVRPLTYDPALPKGARSREIHDLAKDGLPGVFAVTAGPVTTHRSAGRELRDAVAGRIQPSGQAQSPNYSAREFGSDPTSPALLNHYDAVRLTDLRDAASREHVTSLTDLMTRRTGLVWTETCGREGAQQAAGVVADILGWDEQQKSRQVADYLAYLDRYHFRPS